MKGDLKAFASETLTFDGTSKGFNAAIIAGSVERGHARRAMFRLENGQIRYTLDGVTTPMATVGTPVNDGDVVTIDGADNVANFRAVRSGTQNGTAHVRYYF